MDFTGVWVTASLLKSPGPFSVFWPFSVMLSASFSQQRYLMVFHWNLSDSKSPRVSRTPLSILAIVGMVSVPPSISTPLVPLLILWRSLQVHQLQLVLQSLSWSFAFFSSLSRSVYLSLFLFSLIFNLWSTGTAKFSFSFFFFITITRSSIRYLYLKILCVSFSRSDSGLCIYYLVVWSNFNFLHSSQLITFPTQSWLVLYSFCTSLFHSFIMW